MHGSRKKKLADREVAHESRGDAPLEKAIFMPKQCLIKQGITLLV